MNATTYVAPGMLAMTAAIFLSASPTGDRAGGVQVTNLGLATGATATDAGLVAFAVSESDQGLTDLNGDGDTLDSVLHLRDAPAGTTVNLGLAVSGDLYLYKGRLVFGVSEIAEGATDLNGDGDTSDVVIHLHDLATGSTSNVGLAWSYGGMIGEGGFVFDVGEAGQAATDLNGDGDAVDRVLHVLELAKGTVVNTGVSGYLPWNTSPRDGLAVGIVSEVEQGSTDLNGDGDATDQVVHAIQVPSGVVTNLGLASWSGGVVFPGRIAVGVSETEQGATDLNGDGDSVDEVLHVYDLATGSVNNVGLATWSFGMTRFGTHLAFVVDEMAHGLTDLNSDLDALDLVVHTHRVPTATTVNLGLATFVPETGFWVSGERLAFPVPEYGQGGVDLNGDLDTLDSVVHVHDPIRAIVTNLGLASFTGCLRGKRLTLSVSEFEQGGTDLNLDGDVLDAVLHEYDLVTGTLNNLGLGGAVAWNGNETLVEVHEFQEGVDLNGDGDTWDIILFAHEAFAGAPINLGVAGWGVGFEEGLQTFYASEMFQSADLNGDGDQDDSVLHTVEPLYPFGLESDADALSVGAGGKVTLELDARHDLAGLPYLVLGSLSGTTPGLPFGGMLVPLNFDAYLVMTLQRPNQPPFGSTFGLLDVMGEGQASLTLPPGSLAALAGLTADQAYVVFDPATLAVPFVSNPVPLLLVP